MNWLDLIGWIGSALLVWSLLQARVLRLRALNLVGCLVLIGYNAALAVWPMVGLNVVLTVINVWYLRKMLATRHDEQTYQVVEVGVDDQFLAHTLRVHAADIARFNPGFRWGGHAARRSAFLVVRADEVVGVVLSHAEGDDVAQVDLDYVTQRFRDFTPGSSSTGAAASSRTADFAGWSARPAWSPLTTLGSASAPWAARTCSTCPPRPSPTGSDASLAGPDQPRGPD